MRVVPAVVGVGILVCSSALAASALAGQIERLSELGDGVPGEGRRTGKATPECSGGLVSDDGSFENGYRPVSTVTDGALVMRFSQPPASGGAVDQVCLCWTQVGGTDTSIVHDIVLYDDDGPGGEPGTLWDAVPAVTSGIPEFPATAFYQYDLSGLDVILPTGSFYLGVGGWNRTVEGDVFLCADEDGPGGEPAYVTETGSAWTALGTVDTAPDYRALGVRADLIEGSTLSSLAGLIVPGFEVDVVDPAGPTVQFAVRNTTDATLDLEIAYHGRRVEAEPLRIDEQSLGPQATTATDVRFDLTGLAVEDGFANGLAIVTQAGTTQAPSLEGDYFRIDDGKDFATGNRLVRPGELCGVRETRVVDFGSGSQLRILVDRPRGLDAPSFTTTAYDFGGAMIATEEFFTSDHLTVVDAVDLGIDAPFGTIVFDFSSSSGGWVSARYSAFGRFSAEVESVCRDGGGRAAGLGAAALFGARAPLPAPR